MNSIGLGLAALGRPGYINRGRQEDLGNERSVDEMERRCHAILDLAHASGIRYIDTARSYGFAERFLGSWLKARQIAPDKITVGSKWGYTYVGDWRADAPVHETKALTVDTLRRQYLESREWLGDHLSLYQIHSATLESGVLEDHAVLDELDRLKADGLRIGLTVTGPRQSEIVRRALAMASGELLFQAVQATWNLLETSVGPALAEARDQGWIVIVKEALANGRLTDRHAGSEVAVAKQYAAAAGIGLDALAIAAAVAQPWADIVLSGAVTEAQLQSNLEALAPAASAAAAELPSIALPRAEYWTSRAALDWQ